MDPFDRFYRRSLRDVLVSQNVLSNEQADELIDAARQSNEPFATVVLEAGHLTSWDLAKTLAVHYQLPVLPLVGYRFDTQLAAGLPASLLYQHRMLPVGRFGKTWSFAVVEPPSRDLIEDLRGVCGSSMFFFAADAQELGRLLRENVKVVDVAADSGWQALFDEADQSVRTPGAGDTPDKPATT
jgi:hypothetical protein